jgi:predicted nucleic acid-binding Zn ribbon protein
MIKEEKGLSEISSVIDSWFKKKNHTQKRSNFNAFHNWSEIVGPDIANNTEPVKFHKDVLVIKVKNSVWTQELQYMKPKLLEKIRESFPETKIRDLMFRIGTIKDPC